MPQLTQGGKWVFGWTVVSSRRELTIPPEARREYGFRAKSRVVFLRGSRRSGGFGIARAGRLPAPLNKRALGQSQVGPNGQVVVPIETGVRPGDRLLVVRGSGYAPIFIVCGPIFDKALRHPELQVFPHKQV